MAQPCRRKHGCKPGRNEQYFDGTLHGRLLYRKAMATTRNWGTGLGTGWPLEPAGSY